MVAKKTTKISRKAFELKDIERGDIVYLDTVDDTQYLIIDVGNPFCLIENLSTHFGYLYHCTTLYKEV